LNQLPNYALVMQFGICGPVTLAAAAYAGGWDYIEGNAQEVLRAAAPDWHAPNPVELPVPVVNCMLPGTLRIVGPAVDETAVDAYMTTLLHRARLAKIKTIVFGSAAARRIPDGFSRDAAQAQIIAFLKRIAPVAALNHVTIVIEPLNRQECNHINTVAQAMTYVREANHPAVACLVDSYHFWLENEPLEHLAAAMPWIKHVHVADRDGRVAPGESKTSDYDSFFKVIKTAGYDGLCSVECSNLNLATNAPAVLNYLKHAWHHA
jgi:sugar phosphate isomerase/epimerase